MNTFDAQREESATERRASSGLTALADLPQPLSGVSIEAAVAAGRRGVARRRRATALGTAALFTAAALGTWGVMAQHQPSPTTASTPVAGLSGKDPMVPPVRFGWLPGPSTGGFNWSLTAGGEYKFSDENGTVNVSLTLQPVGAPERNGSYTPAGSVDGQPAAWLGGSSDPELLWQYKTGAWADLLVEGATKAQALRVADNLRFGRQSPVALPFRLPGLPVGFTVGEAAAMRNTQVTPVLGNGALLLCATGAGCSTDYGGSSRDTLYLSATTALGTEYRGSLPLLGGYSENQLTHNTEKTSTVKIHGVTARYIVDSVGSITVEFVINGLNVGLEANGSAVKAIGGRDGLVQFLDSITWFGGNPSGWTTDVIG